MLIFDVNFLTAFKIYYSQNMITYKDEKLPVIQPLNRCDLIKSSFFVVST